MTAYAFASDGVVVSSCMKYHLSPSLTALVLGGCQMAVCLFAGAKAACLSSTETETETYNDKLL